MFETIVLYLILVLFGIVIGISIAQAIISKEFKYAQEQHQKYIDILDWVRQIPEACWYNDEFIKHVEKLTDSFKKSREE